MARSDHRSTQRPEIRLQSEPRHLVVVHAMQEEPRYAWLGAADRYLAFQDELESR